LMLPYEPKIIPYRENGTPPQLLSFSTQRYEYP